jgi:Putative porin
VRIQNSLFRLYFTLVLLILSAAQLNAQKITKRDTTIPVDSSRFFFFHEDDFEYGNYGSKTMILNKLDGNQNYQTRQAGLGNAGAPEKQIQFSSTKYDAFRRGPNYTAFFGYNSFNRRFYTSDKPYTKLVYILGQKQELNVQVIHAHPFGKNCNVAFGFDRIRSEGFYRRQNTNNTSINLNGWYRSPGRRYAIMADLYWTTTNNAENGGIKRDSSFEFAVQIDRQLLAINLSSAENKQRLRGAWIKNYWSFGTVTDTLSLKTDSTEFKTRISPSWAIIHTAQIRDEIYQYKDGLPTSGFYNTIYRDSVETNDSTYLWRIENGLWVELFDRLKPINDSAGPRKRTWAGKIGLRHEFGAIRNDTIEQKFQNLFADFAIRYNSPKTGNTLAGLSAWYVLNGYNLGDYRASAFLRLPFNQSSILVGLRAETSRTETDFIFRHYSGNHLRWQNDYSKTGITEIAIYALKRESKLGSVMGEFSFFNFYKPLYFDSTYLPLQYQSTVNAFSIRVSGLLRIKKFRLLSDIRYQSVAAASPIRLPIIILRESAYFEFDLFHSKLKMQTGIAATYLTAYYADASNPNMAQFYVQNSKEIGNYVFLDAWLSLKIRSVRVFVKADHINAGLFGRRYYMVPHYPGNDLAVKFGITWLFND